MQLEVARQTSEKLKEIGRKNNAIIKTRTENFTKDKGAWEGKLKDLEAQIATIRAERDALKTQSSADTTANSQQEVVLRQELESLRQAKAALEKELADERASKSAMVSTQEGTELVVSILLPRPDAL